MSSILERTAALAVLSALVATSACTPAVLLIGGAGATAGVATVQERSTRDAVNDVGIRLRINDALLQEDADLFADVSTEVVEGRVLLTGSAPDPVQKITAARLAWSVPGVREVANEMTVGSDAGAVAFAQDVAITTQIRAKLLTDPEIDSVNYTLETVEGVVHVIGLARSQDELDRVLRNASTVRGVSEVVSHVLLFDDPRRLTRVAGASS